MNDGPTSDGPTIEPQYGNSTDRAVGEALRKLREIMDAREEADPTPLPPREPWVDKPGTLIAAEKEVARWELLQLLQPAVCGGPEKCQLGRCRRAGRCAEIERQRPLVEEARAILARERAKWRPSPPPEPLRRRRRGGLRAE